MHRVLIVDDEKIVRVALRAIIDWPAQGFEILDAVAGARSALEIIDKHDPELVITDIAMPGMDGLELIREARRRGFRGEFIILTNHQDFSYALEALHNDVVDYIIKTDISPESIISVVGKASERLEGRPVLSSNSAASHPMESAAEALRRFRDTEGGSAALPQPAVFLFAFLPSAITGTVPDIPAGTLRDVMGEAAKEWRNRMVELTPDSLAILITPSEASELSHRGAVLLEKMRKLVRLYMNADCGFVLSSLISHSEEFLRGSSRCRRAAATAFCRGYEGLIDEAESDRLTGSPPNGRSLYHDLLQSIRRPDVGIAAPFHPLLADCGKNPVYPESLIALLERLIHLLVADYQPWFSEDEAIGEPPLRASPTLESAWEGMTEFLALLRRRRHLISSSTRPEVRSIEGFVAEHMESRITLGDLSAAVHMSENYLSRLFKAETGMNLVRYINLSKLERAKNLLVDRRLSVKEVTDAVGYETPSYFNRLFNKYFAINPTDYLARVEALTGG